jgi:hypothetical protein
VLRGTVLFVLITDGAAWHCSVGIVRIDGPEWYCSVVHAEQTVLHTSVHHFMKHQASNTWVGGSICGVFVRGGVRRYEEDTFCNLLHHYVRGCRCLIK